MNKLKLQSQSIKEGEKEKERKLPFYLCLFEVFLLLDYNIQLATTRKMTKDSKNGLLEQQSDRKVIPDLLQKLFQYLRVFGLKSG